MTNFEKEIDISKKNALKIQNIVHCSQPRRRSAIDCSLPKVTDPSFKKSCDINAIMAQYQKTGMLPHFKEKVPQYLDLTQVPAFLESFELVSKARDLFEQLPPIVRNAMNNDPRQFETYISNPENHEFLIKHGVLEKRKAAPKDPIVDQLEQLNKKFTLDPKKDDKKEK